MKKVMLILLTSLLLLVGGRYLFSLFTPKTKIEANNAKIIYIFNDHNINQLLSNNESKIIKDILNNKKLYSDNPSCGFSENISICFDNLVFCLACDNCAIIKFGDKFFKISETDREKINKIIENYGGSFPCL